MTAPSSRRLLGRREALRILAVGGAAGAAWGAGLLERGRAVQRARLLMGTGVHLTVLGEDRDAAELAADSALARMAALEALLSRHRPDSELSRLNQGGSVAVASDALLQVLRLAERVSRMGDGAFDVSVQPLLDLYRDHLAGTGRLPPQRDVEDALARVDQRSVRIRGRSVSLARGQRLTLDGIAKGYVVDRGVETLRQHGFANVFVEAGGDLMAAGHKGSERPWRIGIRRPRRGLSLQARFDATNLAAATSGDYMQPFTPDFTQHHILDPRTGRSAPELASATVLAPDAATADALATLCMVLGSRRSREILEDLPGCEGYFVAKDLEVTRTSGFAVS